MALLRRLIRKKKFRRYLINNGYPIAIVGTQEFSWDSLLSFRLFHQQFPKIFCGRSGPRSHIEPIGEIALEDEAIWEGNNGVRRRRGAVAERTRRRFGRARQRDSGGWVSADVGSEREWVVGAKQVAL